MDAVANFLKIISDPTRLKIIMILENHEVSVNDIAVLMNMTKSAVSHQLKVLKKMAATLKIVALVKTSITLYLMSILWISYIQLMTM